MLEPALATQLIFISVASLVTVISCVEQVDCFWLDLVRCQLKTLALLIQGADESLLLLRECEANSIDLSLRFASIDRCKRW